MLLDTVKINGRHLDLAKVYTCTVNEGLALLLPMMGIQFTDLQLLPDLEYNVLKDYVQRLHVLLYTSQGRIRDVAVVAPQMLDIGEPTESAPAELSGGCSAAGNASGAGLALLALGFVLLRRRRD